MHTTRRAYRQARVRLNCVVLGCMAILMKMNVDQLLMRMHLFYLMVLEIIKQMPIIKLLHGLSILLIHNIPRYYFLIPFAKHSQNHAPLQRYVFPASEAYDLQLAFPEKIYPRSFWAFPFSNCRENRTTGPNKVLVWPNSDYRSTTPRPNLLGLHEVRAEHILCKIRPGES